jgi:hypothetical protein
MLEVMMVVMMVEVMVAMKVQRAEATREEAMMLNPQRTSYHTSL